MIIMLKKVLINIPKCFPSDKKETLMVNHGKPLTRREMSRELVENHTRLVDGMPSSVTSSEKDSKGQKGRKVSDLAKTIGVVPESEVGSRSNSIAVQNEYERTTENLKENSVKEGSLVEVCNRKVIRFFYLCIVIILIVEYHKFFHLTL